MACSFFLSQVIDNGGASHQIRPLCLCSVAGDRIHADQYRAQQARNSEAIQKLVSGVMNSGRMLSCG